MSPQLIMHRVQRSLLGVSCIAGGCAALVWMLSHNGQIQQWLGAFESSAVAAEKGSFGGAPAEALPTAEVDTSLINDLHITDKAKGDAALAPAPRVIYNTPRPNWVEADFSEDKGEVKKVSVSSGPYKRKHDAQRALNEELVRVTRDYVADYLGSQAAGTLVPVDLETIRNELVLPGNTFDEQIEISELGPMHQCHALVSFTPSFRQKLDERWRTITVAGRTAKLAVIAVGILMALSVVFGYFKADNATRGYYTTRLQLGSAGAIMALVAGAWMLFRYL
jgi:hypothetical protein